MKEQFDGAKSEFERAIKAAPERTLGYVSLGLILLQMNQPAEAAALLRERVRSGTPDYLVLWFLGEALNRSGPLPDSAEEREAVDALSRSVELNPDLVQSRVLLAKFVARRGDLVAAVKHLNRALEL